MLAVDQQLERDVITVWAELSGEASLRSASSACTLSQNDLIARLSCVLAQNFIYIVHLSRFLQTCEDYQLLTIFIADTLSILTNESRCPRLQRQISDTYKSLSDPLGSGQCVATTVRPMSVPRRSYMAACRGADRRRAPQHSALHCGEFYIGMHSHDARVACLPSWAVPVESILPSEQCQWTREAEPAKSKI